MKKIISLILCVLLSAVILTGCNLFEHNDEKDNAQVIITIDSINHKVVGKKPKLDTKGMPVYDIDGEPETEPVEKDYTSPKIEIYKSQLVNYVNYYLYDQLNGGKELQDAMDYLVDMLISSELLIIEADKLFDAGILYWTKDDVDEIQRSVYTTIGDGIFGFKNEILAANDLDELPEKGGDPATGETTYPLPPEEKAEEVISPAYPANNTGEYQWFDDWYTNDEWYIQGNAYKNTYPGLYGTMKDKSLSAEAFANYLDTMIESSDNIIGVTKEQSDIIKQEIENINKIKSTQGVEYVYPMLGKTLMFKLLVGNSYIKSKKLSKLENYITNGVGITELDINNYYQQLLTKQKRDFVTRANYDSAIDASETILYTPSNRYLFVKHILLPFTAEQTAELNKIKKQEGITESINKDPTKRTENEIRFIQKRAALARKIPVYPHKDGENEIKEVKNDGTIVYKTMTVKDVTAEITAIMDPLKNSPYDAERAFNDLIYRYNTDPGIFGNEKGYPVVYKPETGESEKYMIEFALAARAFRDDNYSIGQIYKDKDMLDKDSNPVPYTVTDYGIHIMYYAMDPEVGVKGMGPNDYVTAGRYSRVYDLMRQSALDKAQSDAYGVWEDRYVFDTKTKYTSINQKIIDKYYDELNGLIYG